MQLRIKVEKDRAMLEQKPIPSPLGGADEFSSIDQDGRQPTLEEACTPPWPPRRGCPGLAQAGLHPEPF
jgi:hypothetical protein